jgi:hypothetical protein
MKVWLLLSFTAGIFFANRIEAAPIMYHFSGLGEQQSAGSSDAPWHLPTGPLDFAGTFLYDADNPVDPVAFFHVNVGGVDVELGSRSPVAQDKLLILGRGTSYVVSDAFAGYASTVISFHDADSSKLDAGVFPASLAITDFDSISFQFSASHNLCAIDTPLGGVCPQAYQSDLHFMGEVTHLEAVPEPSVAMLLATGSLTSLWAWYLRRRRGFVR